jgi:hypothetical protein
MKNLTIKIRIISVLLAVIILLSSCASTTLIQSIPSGGELFLDDQLVGVTPYSMTDTKIVGTCTSVRIEKESFHPFYSSICRTEEADPGAIIGGIFFWFPFLWTLKYKPTHFYKLQPIEGNNDSLDQLWKQDKKVEKQNETTEPKSIEKSGVIKLDDGNQISPEEFEQQKVIKNEVK